MTHVVGLRMVNFQRYRGEHVLQLGPGTYAIVAEDEDDQQRSNWLGKSTIPMALRYALEGHKPKHFDGVDEMISRGQAEMLVEVELSDGTFVSRGKKRDRPYDLKVEFAIDSGSGLREMYQDTAQQEIWKSIGFTADDLLHTAYAEQKQLDALIVAKGTALHDVVTGWLRLEPLVDAADAAASELKTDSLKLASLERELVDHEKAFAEGLTPESLVDLVAKLEREDRDEATRRAANQERLRQHQAWQKSRNQRSEAVVLFVEVLALWAGLVSLPPATGDAAELEKEVLDTRRILDEALAQHRQKLKLAAGKFDGACPVNGEQCPVAVKINSQRSSNAQLAEASERAVVVARSEAAVAATPLVAFHEASGAQQRARAELGRSMLRLSAFDPVLRNPLPLEPPVAEALDGTATAQELTRAKAQQAEQALRQFRIDELKGLLPLARHRVAVARAALAVLGPEGAQKRVSTRAVEAIERVANADLTRVGIPLSLKVRWGRETQQPARQCPQCGAAFPASVKVKACEQCLSPRGMQVKPELRVRLSHVSGAATDLAGLAFRCAAFKWLRQKRQAPWSVAVLDEPFGSLDAANKRALAAHVQQLVASTFDQALIIAHDPVLLDGLQQRIVVTGHGDWSSVAVAS